MTRKPAAKRATRRRQSGKKGPARRNRGTSVAAAAGANAKPVASAKRARPAAAKHDPLVDFIEAAAQALDLPVEVAWMPVIHANLRVTLQHAALVAEFPLPDDAEPAPIFRA